MKLVRRSAAFLAAGLLLVSVAGPASAAPDDTSAGWTSRQLTDGIVTYSDWGFSDYGGTTDAALALKAIGGHADDLTAIGSALAQNVDTWTGTGGDISAGSTAKAVVAAEITGNDPRSFGGVDVVDRLEGRVSSDAPTVGRLQDASTMGTDYANTYSQALAVRGLARAGSARTADAVSFLLKQQCKGGYFRLYFNADKTAPQQRCVAGDSETSAPDTDATALAVLSLKAMPKAARTKAVKSAQSAATAWLKKTQKANGSFGGGPSTKASNSDSTGLAGWALGVTGSCARASKAAAWVRGLQVHGAVPQTLKGQQGAIARNRTGYDKAVESGITDDGTRYEWRKATFDAAPVLSYLSCG